MKEADSRIDMTRRAKLLEAGEYPDQGVNVGRRELIRLVEHFGATVPVVATEEEVLVEVGILTSVDLYGDELYGLIQLISEARFPFAPNGRNLISVNVTADLKQIREVGIHRDSIPDRERSLTEGIVFGDGKWVELWPKDGGAELLNFVREGRLHQTQLTLARALYQCGAGVIVDGERRTVREALLSLLRRQRSVEPPACLVSVDATDHEQTDAVMLTEEVAFFRRYFPNVPLSKITQRR